MPDQSHHSGQDVTLHPVALYVSDLEATRHFYRQELAESGTGVPVAPGYRPAARSCVRNLSVRPATMTVMQEPSLDHIRGLAVDIAVARRKAAAAQAELAAACVEYADARAAADRTIANAEGRGVVPVRRPAGGVRG